MTGPSVTPSVAAFLEHRAQVLAIAARRGVSDIRLFGSAVHGTASQGDALDLLVAFDTTHPGLDFFGFAQEVEDLVGFRIDVGTDVHPSIRPMVEAEAIRL